MNNELIARTLERASYSMLVRTLCSMSDADRDGVQRLARKLQRRQKAVAETRRIARGLEAQRGCGTWENGR